MNYISSKIGISEKSVYGTMYKFNSKFREMGRCFGHKYIYLYDQYIIFQILNQLHILLFIITMIYICNKEYKSEQ